MNSTNTLWHVELFGGLRFCNPERTISRFQTQKTGALAAYLSFHSNRPTPREVMVEMFWPEAEVEAARNSLRVALNSLRKQIEPPGIPTGTVLITDRQSISLNPLAITTDVSLFESSLLEEAKAETAAQRIACLQQAIGWYRGPLLPGFYESWIGPERVRLDDACVGALRRLTRLLVQVKEFDQALAIAQRAVAVDPLSEGAHRNLIQLYAGMGRTAAAAQQYQELKRLLHEHLSAAPSPATRELVAQLGIDGQVAAPIRPTFELPVAPSTPVMQSAEPAIGGSPPSQMAPQSGNLPPSLTRFFGREEEIHEILAQLRCEDTRLVTLTGPGGVGKTRLSIEIGLRLREEYRGQVWFVSLADITATDMIGSSLATVLRLPRLPEREPIEQAIDMLSRSPALLILDNLEQITEGLEGIVGLLLDRLSDLKIIATSRSIIGCEGEHEVALSLLPAPAPRASAEDMSTCASVRLFVDRAQMVRPDFQITPRNAAAIAALCERLDGLPLAIELAAAWASMLQPQQMLERLNQRFDLLVSQRKDRSVRHRTLRGAIEWSYNLLEPHLQRFYRQLATFSGGWTIEAAQEVCGEPRALELIRELHSRSLVIAEPHASEPRFRMLESIREFADERLGAEERAPLETAHSLYFLKVAREHEPYLTGSDGQERLDRLENDVDNLRAALDRLLQCGEMARAVEMAGSLWRFWYATARVSEGRRWLQRAFADCSSSGDALRAKALYGAGRLAACQNAPLAAIAFFEESLSLSAHSGDSAGVLSALVGLALIYWGRREYAGAARCLSQTLDLQRAIGERWPIACALSGLSEALQAAGDLQQALALERESAEIRERLGDRWGHSDALIGIAQLSERLGVGALHGEPAVALPTSEPLDDSYRIADTFLHLGYMAEVQGDYQVARNHYEDSLTIFRETANDAATAFALDNIGRIAYRQREIHTARLRFEEALEIRRYLKDTSGIAESLHHSAVAALSDADPVAARRLLREELAVRRELADGEGEARCLAELTLAEGV